MLNKRGQFFILTAVILSTIVISLVTTKNYVEVSREPREFFDLTYELSEESAKVIDYGVYKDDNKLQDFLNMAIEYANYKDPEVEVIALYESDDGNIEMITYTNKEQSISLGVDEEKISIKTQTKGKQSNQINKNFSNSNSEVIISFNDKNITMNPGEGERFYLIMEKESKISVEDSSQSEVYVDKISIKGTG